MRWRGRASGGGDRQRPLRQHDAIDGAVAEEGVDAVDQLALAMLQLQRGDAHILFEPSSETVTIVVTRAIRGLGL